MAPSNEKDVRVAGVTGAGDVERSGGEKVERRRRSSFGSVVSGDTNAIEGQLFSMNDVDPALDAKMRLVNHVGFFLSVAFALADPKPDHQSDRLDQLSLEAVLFDRLRLHGRFTNSRHTVRYCWSSCGRVSTLLQKWADLCFLCWHVDRRFVLGTDALCW